jgi:hypothetical protein
MRGIVYSKRGNDYIATQDEYKGIKYFIVGGGIFPRAYVMCSYEFLADHSTDDDGLNCIFVHGGVTWKGDVCNLNTHPEGWTGHCFGWDYGHACDWIGYLSDYDNYMSQNIKWSLEEIREECHNAIDQYLIACEKYAENGRQSPFRKFYVTYVNFYDQMYHFHTTDVEVYLEDGLSQGQIAKILEKQLKAILDDVTVKIINFWEI